MTMVDISAVCKQPWKAIRYLLDLFHHLGGKLWDDLQRLEVFVHLDRGEKTSAPDRPVGAQRLERTCSARDAPVITVDTLGFLAHWCIREQVSLFLDRGRWVAGGLPKQWPAGQVSSPVFRRWA